MAAWSGFTDDDLRKMRQPPQTDDLAAASKKATVRKQQSQQHGGVMRSQRFNINPEAVSVKENVTDRMKLAAKSSHEESREKNRQTAGPETNSLHDSKAKETRRLHSVEAKSPTAETSVDKPEIVSDNDKMGISPAQQSQSGSSDIKELDEHEAMSVELGNVQKFQQRQKVIEEANKRKRALLAKAIDDRRKKAKAEAEKLMKVQQELSHLDTLLTADITIIRDKIEEASLEYMEAQKRYEKAEKEFVAAKMDLFSKCETKEQLTEHLYTIIHQNEVRKAKKLVELMEKLAMEVTAEEMELTIPAIPQLTNFTAVSTLHDPHHVKMSSADDNEKTDVPTAPSICEITRSENTLDAVKDAAPTHSTTVLGTNYISLEAVSASAEQSSDSVSDVHSSDVVYKDSLASQKQNGMLQNCSASEPNLNKDPGPTSELAPATSLDEISTPQSCCQAPSNENRVETEINELASTESGVTESTSSADASQALTDVQKNPPTQVEPPSLTAADLPKSDHEKPEDIHSLELKVPPLSISSGKGWTLPFA